MQITEKTTGPARSFSKESYAEAKHKLEILDKKDEERKRTAELKNNLEGYIYTTREKVCNSDCGEIYLIFNFFNIYLFLSIIRNFFLMYDEV